MCLYVCIYLCAYLRPGTVDPKDEKVKLDPYGVPRELDILKEVKSKSDISVYEIASRITSGENRDRYIYI